MKSGIGGLAILYLLIGAAIVMLQTFTGTRCDPPRMIPAVTADHPPGILGALLWPASLYENVWKGDVPFREYLSPTICIETP